MKNAPKRIFIISRNILAVFFIFIGLIAMFTSGFTSGLFMMLLGITLLAAVYQKIKWINFKYAQLVLPLVCFVSFAVFFTDK